MGKFITKTAEDMKSNIMNEIACTYALFVQSYADEDAVSQMKRNIPLGDRQFLKENEQKRFKNSVVFPHEILTARIKGYINDCYDEIEKRTIYTLSFINHGENTEKTIRHFEAEMEISRQKTMQCILSELDRQLLRNSDIKTVMINVGTAVEERAEHLDNLAWYYTKIMTLYRKLNYLTEKGGAFYRIVSNGNYCRNCKSFLERAIPINEAVAGVNFIPFHPNCDCMAEVFDKDGNFIENIGSINDIFNEKNDEASELFNYEKVKGNLVYDTLNWGNDNILKIISMGADAYGFKLSAYLLWLAASGKGNKYISKDGEYASELAKNDEGLNKFVMGKIWEFGESKNDNTPHIPPDSYKIPLSNGDLGAALHNVDVNIIAHKKNNGIWNATVILADKFNFTEFVNPIGKKPLSSILWAANDIAFLDSKLGFLDSVDVEISYNIDFEKVEQK